MPIVKIDDIDISYVTGKKGIVNGRKNLLFIHGGGANYKVWITALHFFQKDYNPIAVELPGHGQSEGDGEKDIDSYVDWIKKIIENMSLKSCVMIGHSMGGAITLGFALKYPQYLEGIVLVSTSASLRIHPNIFESIKEDTGQAVKFICEFAYSDHVPALIKTMGEKEMLRIRPEVLQGDFSACSVFDVLHEINRINVPSLIISGDEDRLTLPKYSHFLHENITGSKLAMIKNAGHMVMIEKPKEFRKAVLDFISNLPRLNLR